MTQPEPFLIIAIDGGAAAGKSSTAAALSQRHRFLHVDTGSFYRTLTWFLQEKGMIPGENEESPAWEDFLNQLELSTRIEAGVARMGINNRFPGEEIRSPVINGLVSRVAALPAVRNLLLPYQREQAEIARQAGLGGVVVEGRDIGSVVFPSADLRFFLTADPRARNRRRSDQGQVDSVEERDRLDSSRRTAPLIQAEGSVVMDTTHLSLDEVVDRLSAMIQAKQPLSSS